MKVYCADSIIIAEKVGNLLTTCSPVFCIFFSFNCYIPSLTNETMLLLGQRIVLKKKEANTELILKFCILFIEQYVNLFCLVRI